MPDLDTWFTNAIKRQVRLKAADGVAEYLRSIGQAPEDWHIDVSRSFLSNFRHDVGIDVGIRNGRFHAEIIEQPRFGPLLTAEQTTLLCRIAIFIYARRLAAVSVEAMSFRSYTLETST